MNHWRRRLMTHFGFSYAELRGFYVVLAVLVFIWAGACLYRGWLAPPAMSSQQAAELQALLQQLAQRPEGGGEGIESPAHARSPNLVHDSISRKNEPHVPTQLFVFDPNTATAEQWQQLGVPAFLARRILNYRSKGGQFRSREDLARIYDFPPQLFQTLLPYIDLPSQAELAAQRQLARQERKAWPTRGTGPAPASLTTPLDINEADSAALEALPGIGPYMAHRILVYREALGGFVHPAQLAETWGIDSVAAEKLMPQLQVSPQFRPACLDVNTFSLNRLRSHPYVSFRLARLIVAYRTQHGPFKQADDLLKIKAASAPEIERIKPYLCL